MKILFVSPLFLYLVCSFCTVHTVKRCDILWYFSRHTTPDVHRWCERMPNDTQSHVQQLPGPQGNARNRRHYTLTVWWVSQLILSTLSCRGTSANQIGFFDVVADCSQQISAIRVNASLASLKNYYRFYL